MKTKMNVLGRVLSIILAVALTVTTVFSGFSRKTLAAENNGKYVTGYTVKFVNSNGAEISSQTLRYGEKIVKPGNPKYPGDKGIYEYTFAGWDKEVSDVCTGDATYKAVFDKSIKIAFYKYNIEVSSRKDLFDYEYIMGREPKYFTKLGSTITVTNDFTGYENIISMLEEAYIKGESDTIYGNNNEEFVKSFVSLTAEKAGVKEDAVDCWYVLKREADGWHVDGGNLKDYTVKFVDYDDSIISERIYNANEKIAIPSNPVRESDETYNYKFAGWDKEISMEAVSDVVYKAVYEPSYIDYTVRFLNEDGSVISEATYHYGDNVVVPADPAKAADETYTYTFAGWDKEVTSVKGNTDYTAVYTDEYNKYIVRFLDEDGTVIFKETYHYGDNVVVPANPVKAADETYTYKFAGWDKEVTSVKGNADYTAKYESSYIDYTVRFLNEDGSVISENVYHYGEDVVVPANPVKAADETYTYTFAGWDKEVTSVKGNADYTAKYEPSYIDYTVRFLNEDGSVISEATYHYGDNVVVPADPVKAADETYNYTFAGWDKEVTSVKGNVDYKAVYESSYIDYTVRFLNEDGSVISEATYHYGDNVVVPIDPVKAADETYTYTFAGWDKEVTSVKGNTDYTAVYTDEYNKYIVRFLDEDGTVILNAVYHYGDDVAVPADPAKEADETYTYKFAGWDKEVTSVKGNADYKAVYESSYIDYTVRFLNEDGSVITEGTYHYGDNVVIPANPAKEADETYTYTFAGWDKEVTSVKENVDYTATYTERLNRIPEVEGDEDIVPEINPGNKAIDDNKPSVRPIRKPEVEADEDVATGDSNMTLYIAVLGLSAATLAVIMGRKKEQDI
ncbi:InlB B-repeat-containing protein [Eshraghiella crossota]